MPSKKNKHRLVKWVSKENLVILVGLLLLGSIVLLRIGQHILSQSKLLTEIIPLWLVLLSAVIGCVSITFLIQKKNLLTRDIIIGSIGIVFSLYGLSIGYRRFPSVFIFTLFAVIFVNLGLIKMRLRMKKRRTAGQSKKARSLISLVPKR
jgi:cytochrome bd-type quinol oxidase subunit 2